MADPSPRIGLFDLDPAESGGNLARELGPVDRYAAVTPFLKASTLQRAADIVAAHAGALFRAPKVRPATTSELRDLRPDGVAARTNSFELWFDPNAPLRDVLGVVIGHFANLSVPQRSEDPIAKADHVPALVYGWLRGFGDEQERLARPEPPGPDSRAQDLSV